MTPLTPPDCDLRDFGFMPLDVRRLRDSGLSSEESPEACWAAVLLWGASWHQVPAASLPDDDRALAQFAGYGRVVREWLKVKHGALRNFVRCDDGRLYHPIVAEKAVEAWRGKLEQRWRTECARIKKQNQRLGTNAPCPSLDEWLSARTPPIVPEDTTQCPSGNGIQGKGIGTVRTYPGGGDPQGQGSESVGDDPLGGGPRLSVVKGGAP